MKRKVLGGVVWDDIKRRVFSGVFWEDVKCFAWILGTCKEKAFEWCFL